MIPKDLDNSVTPEPAATADGAENSADDTPDRQPERPKEIGGRGGLDPTRYGDWEKAGRCIDF